MNTSSGGCCSVGGTHIVAWRRQILRCSRANCNAGTGSNAAGNLLTGGREQSEKLHVKSLGMALRSRIQRLTLSDSCANIPASLILCLSMVAAGEKSGISTWCLIAWQITPNSDSA
ncbi:putative type II secretion protein [Escherichia coli]|nr:putative type II secretion protein [Escherichia coli]